ncbi:hypothetical protein [Novosphingobium sp. MMS21-SN21R]|uniref:hypothetical protein n=1 Tax=Novosphingobium sp. MMS21-SN21R TaxID=2969298 RepID=UPI0028858559|nr:hypothetical protein [Novosphingobium sp. MMS21-SN21R]MDT0507554.1 hypothetical protein [Novosphingobium sp. MMS21-SN21R]MDT0509511.1 hypothetical protein [Novosphingobium sp. MMS21-SN21R]
MSEGRNRQAKAFHKQRKAKARAKHQAEYRSWVDRKKRQDKPRPVISPMGGSVLSLAAMETLIERWDRQDSLRYGFPIYSEQPK